MGHPQEVTFQELGETLESKGHQVEKIAWPHFPDNPARYSFSETIAHTRTVIAGLGGNDLVLLGFSMGGIIATLLAAEFKPAKLGLAVAPYQAGSEDDLAGKYKEWQDTGYRDVTSSRFGKMTVPFSFIQDARQYNALDYIQKVRCPVLFVVGEADDKVPPAASRRLFDAANEPKAWRQIPGMQHKYQYQPEMLPVVNGIIAEFVDQ